MFKMHIKSYRRAYERLMLLFIILINNFLTFEIQIYKSQATATATKYHQSIY